METIEYRTHDKSAWGAGPWQDEPDKVQWPDPATGLPCLITRAHHGAMCGYVGVPEGHPYYGKDYSGLPLDAHGGITFAAPCDPSEPEATGVCHIPGPGEPDHVWWFGFDCAHAHDYAPAMRSSMELAGVPAVLLDDWSLLGQPSTYRTFAYAQAHVTRLAAQLHAVTHRPPQQEQPA